MSRKFKFRSYDPITKVLLGKFQFPPEPPYKVNGCLPIFVPHYPIGEADERYIHQQFTGFLDKNGKEIYEGDIVDFEQNGHTHGPERESWENNEVFFDEKYGQWTFNRDYLLSMLDDIDPKSFIIKGNIFENPELLNIKNDNK